MEQEADVNGRNDGGAADLLAVYNQHREEQRVFRAEFTHTMNWIGAALAALGIAGFHFFSPPNPATQWWAAAVFSSFAIVLGLCGIAALGNAAWQFAWIAQVITRIHHRMKMFEEKDPILHVGKDSSPDWRTWGKWAHAHAKKWNLTGDQLPFWKCLYVAYHRVPHHFWTLSLWTIFVAMYPPGVLFFN